MILRLLAILTNKGQQINIKSNLKIYKVATIDLKNVNLNKNKISKKIFFLNCKNWKKKLLLKFYKHLIYYDLYFIYICKYLFCLLMKIMYNYLHIHKFEANY